MKALFLFLSLILVGCASKPTPVIKVVYRDTPTPRIGGDGVRVAETLKAYPVGRYIDPHNRRMMHEGHTVYRVETTPRWNLQPPRKNADSSGSATKTPSRSGASLAMTDELVMEVNQQRRATQAVIESGKAVSEKLAILTEALEKAKEASVRNIHLQQEVEEIKRQMEVLRQQDNSSPASTSKHPEPAW